MPNAHHTPAKSEVVEVSPETFTLTLTREEAEALAYLADCMTNETNLSRLLADIGPVLRRTGEIAYGGSYSLYCRESPKPILALTLRKGN